MRRGMTKKIFSITSSSDYLDIGFAEDLAYKEIGCQCGYGVFLSIIGIVAELICFKSLVKTVKRLWNVVYRHG